MPKQVLKRAEEIKSVIQIKPGRQLPLSRPLIMGVLNITPDSFSDGGKYAGLKEALSHAHQMVIDGVDIIDIGGESSRPGSDPVGVGTVVEREDPRVTRVGQVLRRFSLDEIPNLVNVLRGEMAIVGPRPTIRSQVELFSERQHRRHAVRPGMTGWAQINGRIGIEWGERIELDIYYVEHRSLRLDLQILARSFWQVVSGRGLYTGG